MISSSGVYVLVHGECVPDLGQTHCSILCKVVSVSIFTVIESFLYV